MMIFIDKLIKYFKNIFNAIFIFDQTSFLKADGKAKHLHGIKFYDLKKVSTINENKIYAYPRFSIFEKTNEENLIFDSSDFWIINNLLATDCTKDFTIGYVFEYEYFKYKIENIKVSIMDVFDDYSTIFSNGNNHSKVYLGKDTPYNIQILIYVNKID